MPTKREHVGAAVLDSLIYVSSGRLGTTSMDKLECYSPRSGKWYARKNMPTLRSDIGFGAAGGKLYAMGGEKPGIFDVNEEYDPQTDTWKTGLKMTGMRKAMSVVGFEDTLFVFGGFSANGLINTVEAFAPPAGSTGLLPGPRTEGIRRQSGSGGREADRDAAGRLHPYGRGGPGKPGAARNSVRFAK
jgi:hypothetical protein